MDSLSVGCRTIVLRKLSGAVVYSVIVQLIILLVYLFVISSDIFQPLEWFINIFRTLSSISTWLHVLPFGCIIFAQSIICAKDYVVKPVCNVSRFQKLISYFSLHNLMLLLLYPSAGFLNIWLYLSLSKGKYNSLFCACQNNQYCLNEEHLFMVLSGFWVGIFFFLSYSTQERSIEFPVLQQHKMVQFKAKFVSILEESKTMATWPIASYIFVYSFWGQSVCQFVSDMFGVINETRGPSVVCYFYIWLFAILYFFFMNIMSMFFKLFLTEAIEFPLECQDSAVPLTSAIDCVDLPIIQHLACLDLYLLSIWAPNRRKVYFSLSLPGQHPHHWNKLFTTSLKLISQFTKNLNDSVNLILEPAPKKEATEEKNKEVLITSPKLENKKASGVFKSPVISPFLNKNVASVKKPYVYIRSNVTGNLSQSPTNNDGQKYRNMRNMSLVDAVPTEIVEITYQPPKFVLKIIETYKQLKTKLNAFVSKVKAIFAFNYFFSEIPEVYVHSYLRSGQPIVWLTQALSHIAVAAYTEDAYGIIQKDLLMLITILLELRQCIDKLNRLLTLNRRGARAFTEHSVRMKHNINAAAKRSLYNICLKYKTTIDELPLSKETFQQLQYYRNV